MKTIGLLGGMSWESTVPYYRFVNEAVRDALGGLHSAKVLLLSVDFHELETLMREGRWDGVGRELAQAAATLEVAGADFLVLCTNTMHRVAPSIEAAVKIPLLHIADPTAEAIRRAGCTKVGLLGTRFTMEEDFYRDRLESKHGIGVLVPAAADRDVIHRIIFDELCLGIVRDASRGEYRRVIAELAGRGAQAVVLGCTEIAMLVEPADSPVPLFDTTELHARAAARMALAG
ncbi:MAG: aspartate/glutamate racemase family protein [Betaproteobacteria bacterium]|nr:aspartate/glutamate racemase family protein [Betaproteobacteria bacterium]